jgi:hypothetical protein
MIAFNCRNIILLALLGPAVNCFSQTDTTGIQEKETEFVNEKFRDRTTMFYIAGKAEVKNSYEITGNTGIYVACEHKILRLHVIGAGLGYFLQSQQPDWDTYYYEPKYSNGLSQGIQLSLSYKYLTSLDRRMSKGLTGNNFFSNYFMISPAIAYLYGSYYISDVSWDFTKSKWAIKSERKVSFVPALKLGYGIQRMIRTNMLIDINAGIQIGEQSDLDDPTRLLYFQIKAGYIFKY